MPYITFDRRDVVNPPPPLENAQSSGELNYQLTIMMRRYVKYHGLSYATINDVVGALEGAKLEFYRRVAAPYEDGKVRTNGDVYPNVGFDAAAREA